MIVRCINDVFTGSTDLAIQTLKNIRTVGEDSLIPQIGNTYEVIGYYHDVPNNVEGYLLAEIDTTPYGCKLCFNSKNFEIFDDTFVPNIYIKEGVNEGPARQVQMYLNLNIDQYK